MRKNPWRPAATSKRETPRTLSGIIVRRDTQAGVPVSRVLRDPDPAESGEGWQASACFTKGPLCNDRGNSRGGAIAGGMGCRVSSPPHRHFFNPACQLRTTVNGTPPSVSGTRNKKRSPSGEGAHWVRPKMSGLLGGV